MRLVKGNRSMNIEKVDHSIIREWLYLERDGALTTGQRSQLQQHLGHCPECQHERLELQAFDRLIDEAKIPVSSTFTSDVMKALPAAGWEARAPRHWIAALGAVAALLLTAALLIGVSSDQLMAAAPLGAVAAVVEMFRASALAGAGMLAASWKGLGLAIQEALGDSVWNLVGFGVLVLSLNILLIRLLTRVRPSRAVANDSDTTKSH